MNIFEELYFEINDAQSLDTFLTKNIQAIIEYGENDFRKIAESKDVIEKIILLKYQYLKDLNYSKYYNKAFIVQLLGFCQRFYFISAAYRIFAILEENKINTGVRLDAYSLFLYNIDSNQTLISRFAFISDKIQDAINYEDDDDNKAIATFLNYYSIIIQDTFPHVKYIQELQSKIKASLAKNKYPFLRSHAISKALNIKIGDTEKAFNEIQLIIDDLLGKVSKTVAGSKETDNQFLVESNSEYANALRNKAKSFTDIRNISVNKILEIADRDNIYLALGRGVKVLENESQMYAYMNSFGNSHFAKMNSICNILPDSILNQKIDLIDWGCGQGLATMVFLESVAQKNSRTAIRNTILIEPSIHSIKRASLHIQHYKHDLLIKTICKDMDALNPKDIKTSDDHVKIHLFSNILDVETFSLIKLQKLIFNTQKGLNVFVCVSPFINDMKTERLEGFKRFFENSFPASFKSISEKTFKSANNAIYWDCNNNFKGRKCFNHDERCGCDKKWSRVERVFKVNIS